jgi:hypothetical protein
MDYRTSPVNLMMRTPLLFCLASGTIPPMKVQPIMPEECFARARPDPNLPPPNEGPIGLRQLDNGRIAWRRLRHPDRDDQSVALWVPDGVTTVRGIIVHLHRASEAARTDFHTIARSLDFAVYAMLVRWANFEKVLPDQLSKLGAQLGHPEVVNVPWVAIGGSRNAAAFCCYAVQDPNPDRILCVLTNGGPGIAVNLRNRKAITRFCGIPIMSVNGTEDPYVEGLDWFRKIYPRIRAARLPWSAAPDWGGGHAGLTNGGMYWPFVCAVMRMRYPANADPRRGRVRLRPFRENQGLLVGPVDWGNPGGETAASSTHSGTEHNRSVWMPDAATTAVWRAYSSRNPVGVLKAVAGRTRGTVLLKITGVTGKRVSVARFLDGDRLLAVRRSRPFQFTTRALSRGIHAVYAECLEDSRHRGFARPVIVADGRVVDQEAGTRVAGKAGVSRFPFTDH